MNAIQVEVEDESCDDADTQNDTLSTKCIFGSDPELYNSICNEVFDDEYDNVDDDVCDNACNYICNGACNDVYDDAHNDVCDNACNYVCNDACNDVYDNVHNDVWDNLCNNIADNVSCSSSLVASMGEESESDSDYEYEYENKRARVEWRNDGMKELERENNHGQCKQLTGSKREPCTNTNNSPCKPPRHDVNINRRYCDVTAGPRSINHHGNAHHRREQQQQQQLRTDQA